ncbi:MAG: hypothetical protein GWP91_02380 [Rhodobacterales bacterium]|nr:hypothetical protein [Rhodobacterales bacterium]
MIVWMWLALAGAAEPVSCNEVSLPSPEQALSVAWVSPAGQSVKRNARVQVVSTAELRRFMVTHEDRTVGRMLRVLGMRKRDGDPNKRYKVTVFDVSSAELCRPLDSEDGAVLAGIRTCDKTNLGRHTNGCGTTVDHQTGDAGLVLYQGTWADLARNGFCVLPAQRFVSAATER